MSISRKLLKYIRQGAWIGLCVLLLCSTHAHAYVPVIDPGHGGEDGGAVADSGVVESRLNLEISQKVKLLFCLFGVDPVMVRETDISLHSPGSNTLRQKKVSDLKNRVAMINKVEDGLLISIHQNTYPESRYSGAHVFYNGEQSKPFADLMQKRIREVLDPGNNREPKKVPSSVYLMKHVTCPAILVECGFLTNHRELGLLQTPTYQTKFAATIVSVYFDFVNGSYQTD